MSTAFLLATVLWTQGQAPDTATFTDAALGLSFTHPKAWRVEVRKNDWHITAPLSDGAQATLDLFRAGYVGAVEDWEATQRNMNGTLRWETLRQWQEVILGVPLLLTKSQPESPAAPKLVLQGLIYSRTPLKLLFRLTAPAGSFDTAEFALRQALETLRTLDGSLPQPEDPNRVPDPPAKGRPKNQTPKPPPIVEIGKPKGSKHEKAPVTLAVKAGGKDLVLHIPLGFKAESQAPDAVALEVPGIAGKIAVTAASTLDSVSPARALMKASLASLQAFQKSGGREETAPKASKAGALVSHVWRTGSNEAGPLASFEAVGLSGNFYWVMTWIGQPGEAAKTKELLVALASQMSLELEP